MIHREGHSLLLGLAVGLSLICYTIGYFTCFCSFWFIGTCAFSIIFYGLILQFFRNPKPNVIPNAQHILAPCDGKVVVIEKVFEPEFLKKECIQVSIFMSPFNVHVNRNPISGIVKYFKYHPGKYLVAWHPKSSTENERTTYVIAQTNEKLLLLRQIAGALAQRIKWYVKEEDQVEQGQEFGFIKFGSRVDVFIPLDAEVKVNLNQKTKAGITVIAHW